MYVYVKNQYRNGAIIVLITILFIPTSQKKKRSYYEKTLLQELFNYKFHLRIGPSPDSS